MRIHPAECRPTVRKFAIPVCTKWIREKRDREVKKAWKGSNAWADDAMMGNRQQRNGMKSGGNELPMEMVGGRGEEEAGRARGGEGKGGVKEERNAVGGKGSSPIGESVPMDGLCTKMACLPIQLMRVACERVSVRVWPVLGVGGQRLKNSSPHPVPCRPRVSA